MDSRGLKADLIERLLPVLEAEAKDITLETAPQEDFTGGEPPSGGASSPAAVEGPKGDAGGGADSEGGGAFAAQGLGRAAGAGASEAAPPPLSELVRLSKVSLEFL